MMQCPFRYRFSKRRYSFGVSGEFLDFIWEKEQQAEAAFNVRYPTCWDKFLHWLGLR